MEITKIERYKLRGVEFKTLATVREHVENQLGLIIDKLDVTLTPKQKLNILQGLTDNKRDMVTFLSVEFNMGDDFQGDFKNILDIITP